MHHLLELFRLENQVQVVLQDDVCEELQGRVLLVVLEGIEQYVEVVRRGEEGQPSHDGAGDEVVAFLIVDFIARPHTGEYREWAYGISSGFVFRGGSLRGRAFPGRSLGTRWYFSRLNASGAGASGDRHSQAGAWERV